MLKYPELFACAAPGGSGYEPEKRIQDNDGAESENVVFATGYNTWDLAESYAQREDKKRLPVMLWVGTKGFNYEFNLKYSEFLKSLGIPHDMIIAPEIAHSASGIYEIRGDELMGFHQKHFAQP
jgi:endo-1,4-beta-xylanase